MARSLEHLPIPILEQCFNRMSDEALTQVEQVSKRFHLATRPTRHEILQCCTQYQDTLDQMLKRVTQLALGHKATNVSASPFREAVTMLSEIEYTDIEDDPYMAKRKAKTETVIQILKANNGVSKLELTVCMRGHPVEGGHPDFLAAISALYAAAHRHDTTVFLAIEGLGSFDDSVPKLDAKISAVLACFPENSITSLNLHNLHVDDLDSALSQKPALTWLKTLRLRDCHLSVDGRRSMISFPYLDKLVIDDSDVPSGLIYANSASLRKLVIDTKSGTSSSDPLPVDFANLQALSISRNCDEQDSLELQLLQKEHVRMPALRILRIAVDDASTLDSNLASVLNRRLPILKKLEFIENSEGRSFVDLDEGTEYLGYLALVKACAEHHVKMSAALLSRVCLNPQNLARELQRLTVLQSRVCMYQLDLQFQAIREMPFMLDEAVQLPELRRLSVSLQSEAHYGQAEAAEHEAPQDGWEKNLVAVLSQLSAPKCEDFHLCIVVHVGENTWEAVARLLERIASRPPWPALERIRGYCAIEGESDEDEDEDEDEEAGLVAAISVIGTQSGIDFSDFLVHRW